MVNPFPSNCSALSTRAHYNCTMLGLGFYLCLCSPSFMMMMMMMMWLKEGLVTFLCLVPAFAMFLGHMNIMHQDVVTGCCCAHVGIQTM